MREYDVIEILTDGQEVVIAAVKATSLFNAARIARRRFFPQSVVTFRVRAKDTGGNQITSLPFQTTKEN